MAIECIKDPALIEGYLRDASNILGHAEGLTRPETTQEVSEIVRHCQASETPLTISAQRTSTTGGPVPFGGWILSMEKMDQVLWTQGHRARVQGGLILGAFQDQLEAQGLSFPPDPTSRYECTIGAAIACNASGARSFRFGPTRDWVEAIEVVLPNGEVMEIDREKPIPPQWPRCQWIAPSVKTAAGYLDSGKLIDLFIGQEGTLGVITEATLRLTPAPEHRFSLLSFFEDLDACLSFVERLREEDKDSLISPSCIEFFGPQAIHWIRESAGDLSNKANYGLWCEQDSSFLDEDRRIEAWFDLLESCGAEIDDTLFAQDDKSRARIAKMRHAVPAGINEQVVANGMPKVGTDCSVPQEKLREMIEAYFNVPLPHVLFGHIGNAHLHLNMLPKTPAELSQAKDVYKELCRKAVSLGGSVSAEHGIGKLKREHFSEMVGPETLQAFRQLKRYLDPNWILGRGNLFAAEESDKP